MKPVGQVLKNQRLKLTLNLEDVARRTRIQPKHLKHLEESRYDQLPTATFVKGFIKNYSKAVGLDPKNTLAIFRRDFAENASGHIVPRSLVHPIEKTFSFSPKLATGIFFALLAAIISTLFIRQMINFYQGPKIAIDSPLENQQVISPLEIRGTVENAIQLQINNQTVFTGTDGRFTTQIQLSPGDHTITATATSRDGKTRTIQRHITVNP